MNDASARIFSPIFHLMSDCDFRIDPDDWRPTQDVLVTRFAQVRHPPTFRTINQDCESENENTHALPTLENHH